MTTAHAMFQFVAGDDWEIHATLLDETGAPYDLAAASVIKWTMYASTGHRVLADGDYSISIVDAPAGTCLIRVLAPRTTTVTGGRYSDAIRITTGGVTSTLSLGPVHVVADPWKVATPAVLRVVA